MEKSLYIIKSKGWSIVKNNKLKIISVAVLTLLAVGLIVFTVYYLISNKDTNKVTTKFEEATSHAKQIDQVPIKDIDSKITLDTLPKTDGVLTKLKFQDFTKLFQTSKRSILVVTRTGCSYCEEFLPQLKNALGNLGISAYEVNMSNLGQNESLGKYIVVTGTPITYIIENGNVTHTFSGSTDTKTIEAFLDLYYIR